MAKRTRVAAILLAVVLAFAVVSSCLVIVGEADHDCSGADCEICLVVNACANFLRGALSCAPALALAVIFASGTAGAVSFCRRLRVGATPVILRVKLSN